MDHDPVRAGLDVRRRPRHGVLHAHPENEALDAGDDHEVARHLRPLALCKSVAEVLDRVLRLVRIGAEEGVSLQAALVLDHDGRDAEPLERLDREDEVLGLSAGVAVVDDRLRRHLDDVAHGLHARRDVDGLDVGLALRGRVGEAREPHPVELALAVGRRDPRLLDDQPGEPVVRLEQPDERLRREQPPQALQPDRRRDADLAQRLVERGRRDALGVRHLDELAAPLGQHLDHALPRCRLDARLPVVAVDDEVGPVLPQVRLVVERLLGHDARDALQVLDHDLPLLVAHVRQPLVARDRRVGEQADRHLAVLAGLREDVQVARVDEVGTHADVDGRLRGGVAAAMVSGDWARAPASEAPGESAAELRLVRPVGAYSSGVSSRRKPRNRLARASRPCP